LIIAAALGVALVAVFIAIYRNAMKTAHLPRAPFGADVEVGAEETLEVGGIRTF
jgi:hypothetical protein